MLKPSTRMGTNTNRLKTSRQTTTRITIRTAVRFGFRPISTIWIHDGEGPVSTSLAIGAIIKSRGTTNKDQLLGTELAFAFLSLLFVPARWECRANAGMLAKQ